MNAGFYKLYRRSQYRAQAGGESGVQCEQKERFACAAIAFCWKHNEAFRRAFWFAVCNANCGDIPNSDAVKVESDYSSDLSIQDANSVYVIEVKLGAELENHQNPAALEFWETGYGPQILRNHPGKNSYYIVLGYPRELDFGKMIRESGFSQSLHVFQKKWSDLASELAKTETSVDLVTDFCELMTQFGETEFAMQSLRNIKIRKELSNVVPAFEILKHLICTEFKIKNGLSSFEGEGARWGFYLNKSIAPDYGSKLEEEFGCVLAWFGYIVEESGPVTAGILFWCKDKPSADKLSVKIKDAGVNIQEENEMDGSRVDSVALTLTPTEEVKEDLNWFRKILIALGLLS